MCVYLFKPKSCLKTLVLWLTILKTSWVQNLHGNGFLLEHPSIAGCKELLLKKAKISSADSDFVSKPSRTYYSSEEKHKHAKIPWRLLHKPFLSALLDEDGVCWLKVIFFHKNIWPWKSQGLGFLTLSVLASHGRTQLESFLMLF